MTKIKNGQRSCDSDQADWFQDVNRLLASLPDSGQAFARSIVTRYERISRCRCSQTAASANSASAH